MERNFINSWKSVFKTKNKQNDKFDFTLRISFVTVFSLKIDISQKYMCFRLMNFGIEIVL